MPTIGLKYYFKTNAKDNKTFVNGAFFKPFLSTDGETDSDAEFNDVTENVSIMGFELGVGAEYLMSKNFSIAGEFGFRMIMGSDEYTYEDYYYDSQTGREVYYEAVETFDLGLGMTYAKINLNYLLEF